jgi:hypothetical protein
MATPPWSATTLQHLLEKHGRDDRKKSPVFAGFLRNTGKMFEVLKHLLEELQHLLDAVKRLLDGQKHLVGTVQHLPYVLQRQTVRLSCRYDASI